MVWYYYIGSIFKGKEVHLRMDLVTCQKLSTVWKNQDLDLELFFTTNLQCNKYMVEEEFKREFEM